MVVGTFTGEKGIRIERTTEDEPEITKQATEEAKEEYRPPLVVLRDAIRERGLENFEAARGEAVREGLQSSLHGYMIKLEERFRWVNWMGTALQYCCLIFLVLAAGPLWVRRRLAGQEDRNRQAVALIPYFLVTTTAVFFLTGQLIGLISALQGAQIAMATFGAPPIAMTNDFLVYLKFMGPEQLAATQEIITSIQITAQNNPLEGLGAMDNLMNGVAEIRDSRLLGAAFVFVGVIGRFSGLYGPAIALVTLALMYTTIAPIVKEIVGYPMRVARGEEEAQTGAFTKKIFRLFWQEMKAMFYGLWSLFWVLLVGVLCMHILCFPVVVALVASLQVSLQAIHTSAQFHELAWFAGLVSMASYLLAGFLILMVPMGMSVKQSYAVARDKVIRGKTFQEYPEMKLLRRMIYTRLVGRTLLAAMVGAAVYLMGVFVASNAALELWWMTGAFGPVFFGILWLLKPWSGFWRLYQSTGRLDHVQLKTKEHTA